MRRAAAAMTGTAVLLALAGCAGSGTPSRSPSFAAASSSKVDVDTPQLRQIKRDAAIESCVHPDAPTAVPDHGLPAEPLPCLGGGPDVVLAGLRGTPTVINLWASWCEPCRKELPELQRLHEQAGERVRVIGLDFQDAAPEAALRLAAGAGVTYPLVADPAGSVRDDLGVIGLPQTIFVSESGRIVATERREVRSYAQLADLVRTHLKVTP